MNFLVHALDATESTQAELGRLAAAGAPEGTVVTARHQHAGRGRRGRDWWDEPGQSLLCSVLLRPAATPATVPQLSLVAGLAVAEALTAAAGVAARIRWPNDVLVEGGKVCGILAEATTDPSGASPVLMGIGVNLNQTQFPEALRARATSLRVATGRAQDGTLVLTAVLEHLASRYATWQRGGFAALRTAWLARSTVPGQAVRLPDGRVAEAVDVADDGVLLARAADGSVRRIVSATAVEEVTAHAARH